MVGKRCTSQILVVVCAIILISALTASVWAQGLPQSPYSAPTVVRADEPRAVDSILLTPQLFQGILPLIPNLQFGYLYSFGDAVDSGRLTADYLLPMRLGRDTTIFGEAHGEFQNFWKTIQRTFTSGGTTTTLSGFNERTDLSFGGGVRRMIGEDTLIGVNGFFDTTKLGHRWYSSGSLGFEMAAALQGNDAIDLNFNWYGNLFNSDVLANAFRRGPQNYDFQAGYSHELYNDGPDLRLYATGYRFSSGAGVYGVRGGAELKTRDGMFSVKYAVGDDRLNSTYHTVGAFVNVGFQIENLIAGDSPFTKPEPIFRSPRNLRKWLTEKARRSWTAPASISSVQRLKREVDNGYCVVRTAVAWKAQGAGPPPGTAYRRTTIPPTPPMLNYSQVTVVWRDVTSNTTAQEFWFCGGGADPTKSTDPISVPFTGDGEETLALNNQAGCTVISDGAWHRNAIDNDITFDGSICFIFR